MNNIGNKNIIHLFIWEDHLDVYESDGEYYDYDTVNHKLYSHWFHDVAGGCGHGGYGPTVIAAWDDLLKAAKTHSGEWVEDTWRQLCADYARHPGMKCKALDELMAMRNK